MSASVAAWSSQKRSAEGFVAAGLFGDCAVMAHSDCPRYHGRFACGCQCHNGVVQRVAVGGWCYEGEHHRCPQDNQNLVCSCECHREAGARPSARILGAGGTAAPEPKVKLVKRRRRK